MPTTMGSLGSPRHPTGLARDKLQKTYHLITYGCQMNKSDSERIVTVLEKNNFKKASLAKADFIILNLCSVRQSAIDRVFGKINQIKKSRNQKIKKTKNQKIKKSKIILTGCILDEDKKKFRNRVDYILDINNLPNWPFITKTLKHKNTKALHKNKNYLCINPNYESKSVAYVPIMTGCNNFCSYCVVPYTRGREKSRPAKKILKEIKNLINKNYKFIILLGQNVNSYCDKNPKSKILNPKQSQNSKFKIQKNNIIKFPDLLKLIDAIPGDYWLNFITSHPKDLSDNLINCFKECRHLIPYLHLPLQSGSNKILKAMNRNYTAADYLKLIRTISGPKAIRNISIGTDIIVGFPNETKKDFKATADLMKDIKFDMAYIAQYSPRPGTSAAKLVDNMPKAEKKQREKVLTEILKKTALENNKKMIGKEIEVLVEANLREGLRGLTRNFKHVKITAPRGACPEPAERVSPRDLIGNFIKVKITNVGPWGLEGRLVL